MQACCKGTTRLWTRGRAVKHSGLPLDDEASSYLLLHLELTSRFHFTGVRVDLTEVEQALRRHPGVAAVAAKAWEHSTGELNDSSALCVMVRKHPYCTPHTCFCQQSYCSTIRVACCHGRDGLTTRPR